jgi:phosphatidylcholine synthase
MRQAMTNNNIGVWAVHVLTASGAAIALVAAVAAGNGAWQLVFLCLGIAMIVDGIDGPIARKLDVGERLPWFDGATLDLVVDYSTYVLIPALVLAMGDLVSQPFATIAGIVIAIVGALYFADTRMKTTEQSFRGFPAVWNVVVYQLMIYKFPETVTLLIVAAFAALTFSPVEFVHPLRVKRLRPLTAAMAAAWGVLALLCLIADLNPSPLILVLFSVVNLYFCFIGVYLQLTRDQAKA